IVWTWSVERQDRAPDSAACMSIRLLKYPREIACALRLTSTGQRRSMLPILLGRLVPCSQNRHRRYRIGDKRIAQTNVPADERIRGVAGLRLDPPGRGACRRGAGHEPGPQRVSG